MREWNRGRCSVTPESARMDNNAYLSHLLYPAHFHRKAGAPSSGSVLIVRCQEWRSPICLPPRDHRDLFVELAQGA